MKNKLIIKGLALVIFLLFTLTAVIPQTIGLKIEKVNLNLSKSRGYIQDLIDNASDGDAIYIPSGVYHENIVINKSISLIGENKYTTIINGSRNGTGILVNADWVNISGFSIEYCDDSNTTAGINILSNYNIIIENNIINNGYGIVFESSSYNYILNNVISKSRLGVFLYNNSNYNKLSGNTFYNNGLFVYQSYNNIVENNTVNDKPLVYLEGESEKVILDAGQVILSSCDDITIENLNLSDIDVGIELFNTNNSKIIGSEFSNNKFFNIVVFHSNNNTILNNDLSLCRFTCIGLEYSDTNTIIANNISNNYEGIELYNSNFNTIKGNKILNNRYEGVDLVDSNRNVISENIISSNYNNSEGISFFDCYFNYISNNFISKNDDGIRLHYSSFNEIYYNNISNNNKGLGLGYHCNNNTIDSNYISSNYENGIQIYLLSKNNSISNNILSENIDGLYIYNSENNIISNNSFFNDGLYITSESIENNVQNNEVNGKPLIFLKDESDVTIDTAGQIFLINCDNINIQNQDLSNTAIGVWMFGTNNSQILRNSIMNNRDGIYLEKAYNNNIIENILLENIRSITFINSERNKIKNNFISKGINGILSYSSDNNSIMDNHILKNVDGIFFSSCKNNNISSNNISGNDDNGIVILKDSSENTLIGNNVSLNSCGIKLSGEDRHLCKYNKIIDNNIFDNSLGIELVNQAYYNSIFHNNFINNSQNAFDDLNNSWDDGKYGNYWSDYTAKYPDAKKLPFKGIWDTPYEIDGGQNKDNYPLINQWPKSRSSNTLETRLTFNNLFLLLFERLSNIFPILRYILRFG
ncbi:MAG: right-handed parallel beta-helix repeat-containing protein [Thermoplasmatales archaeon]|nr:MAG: right-handed parallel beta-helix repeat-containing protein [Thermoplasmatales archaeon]